MLSSSPSHSQNHLHLQEEETFDATFQAWLTKLFTNVLALLPASFREIKVSLEYSYISVKLDTFYYWMHGAARCKCHRKVRGWD